jgi:Mn2+/Fe2+ NRAMP family transporter
MMNIGLLLDIAQFAVGGIGIYIYFQCSTILETVILVCGLSLVLIPLQYMSNKIHEKAEIDYDVRGES